MLINRVHIYIFGILKHQGLIPCTRFWGVKSMPAEKVLQDTVRGGSFDSLKFGILKYESLEVNSLAKGKEELALKNRYM